MHVLDGVCYWDNDIPIKLKNGSNLGELCPYCGNHVGIIFSVGFEVECCGASHHKIGFVQDLIDNERLKNDEKNSVHYRT